MARNYENELISKCRPNIEARRRGTGGRHATSLTSRAVVSLFLSLGGLHVRVPRKTCRGYPLVDRYVRNATITPPRDYFTGIVLPICVYREKERERERLGEIARELEQVWPTSFFTHPVLGKKDYPLTSIFTSNHPTTIKLS